MRKLLNLICATAFLAASIGPAMAERLDSSSHRSGGDSDFDARPCAQDVRDAQVKLKLDQARARWGQLEADKAALNAARAACPNCSH